MSNNPNPLPPVITEPRAVDPNEQGAVDLNNPLADGARSEELASAAHRVPVHWGFPIGMCCAWICWKLSGPSQTNDADSPGYLLNNDQRATFVANREGIKEVRMEEKGIIESCSDLLGQIEKHMLFVGVLIGCFDPLIKLGLRKWIGVVVIAALAVFSLYVSSVRFFTIYRDSLGLSPRYREAVAKMEAFRRTVGDPSTRNEDGVGIWVTKQELDLLISEYKFPDILKYCYSVVFLATGFLACVNGVFVTWGVIGLVGH